MASYLYVCVLVCVCYFVCLFVGVRVSFRMFVGICVYERERERADRLPCFACLNVCLHVCVYFCLRVGALLAKQMFCRHKSPEESLTGRFFRA